MKSNSLAEQAAKISKPATNNAAATGALAKTEQKKVLPPTVVVGNLLAKYKDAINDALPSVMTPERFSRIATSVIANNPKLMQAVSESPRTLVSALLTCAQLGIEPNTPLGQGYLIPYRNYNKVTKQYEMQVNFQLGYQGVIDLCYRSGEVTMIRSVVIHEKDDYEYQEGLHPVLTHRPYRGADAGKPIAYYGVFQTKSGASGFAFLWNEQVLAHAKQYSKSYDADKGAFSGPWATDFDSMAKKTVILQALKYAPKKSDFARALATDSTTKSAFAKDMTEVPNDDYIDAEIIKEPAKPAGKEGDAADNKDAQPAKPALPDKSAAADGDSKGRTEQEALFDVK